MSGKRFMSVAVIFCLILTCCLAGCAKKEIEGDNTLQSWLDEHDSETSRVLDYDQHVTIGHRHYSKGSYEKAFLHFSKALALKPEDTNLRLLRGDILVRRGLMEKALNEYMGIHKDFPDNRQASLGVGKVYFAAGMYKDAKKYLSLASNGTCEFSQADNLLGVIANWEGRPLNAKISLLRAHTCNPDNGEILNNLGMSYLFLHEYEFAIVFFRKAIRKGCTPPKTFNNLGIALVKCEKYGEAFEAFRSAGDEAQAYNNMGYVLYLEGELKKAVECFETAIRIHPTYYQVAAGNLKRARTAMQGSELGGEVLSILDTQSDVEDADETAEKPVEH